MAAGVACGLQNRRGARNVSRVGSTPTRSRHLVVALVALAAAGIPTDGKAQEPVPGDSAVATRTDSAGLGVAAEPRDTAAAAPADAGGPPVSPMGAFFRSLVLPGWGQASVGRPVRGAFYFTMEAGSLWMLFKTQSKLNAAERLGDEDLISSRKNQKEDWIVLAVFWALFSGVDAWVSANMWDFQGAVVPPPDGSPGVAVQYSVPVGGPD